MKGLGILKGRWWNVAGAFVAMIVNSGAVIVFAFSLFILPLNKEFGWSRSEISLAVSINLGVIALIDPLMGWLMDRFGVKRVTLIAIIGFAASTALLSLTSSLLSFYMLFAIVGLFAAGHSPMPYAKVLSGWFDENRGLALGIAMAGSGLSVVVLPQYARYLIDNHGWRGAYLGLGAAVLIVGMLAVAILIRNPPGAGVAAVEDTSQLAGLTLSEAARTVSFWAVLISTFCISASVNGISVHAVPLLTDHGMAAGTAAGFLVWLGIGSTVGRLCSGFIFDRVHAPYFSALVFAIGLMGVGLLLGNTEGSAPLIAVICVGLASGAEVDVIGYLTGRYFGMKRYGLIFGCFFGVFTFAAAVGPFVMSKSFDTTHSYDTALWIFGGAMLVAIGLLLSLGRYRYGDKSSGAVVGRAGLKAV
jgi:MFS family permease